MLFIPLPSVSQTNPSINTEQLIFNLSSMVLSYWTISNPWVIKPLDHACEIDKFILLIYIISTFKYGMLRGES